MIIRKAVVDDVVMMKELHDRAVMELCRNDYTFDQLQGWISRSPLDKYYWRLETQRIFIAEEDGRMLGYVRWYPKTNELCSICVEPGSARQGIGTLLMEHACEDAKGDNVDTLWLDASLTAVPFYRALGWEYVAMSTDGPLDSVRMVKHLTSSRNQGKSADSGLMPIVDEAVHYWMEDESELAYLLDSDRARVRQGNSAEDEKKWLSCGSLSETAGSKRSSLGVWTPTTQMKGRRK